MIRSIKVMDVAKSCVPWWGDVPWLKNAKLEFTPGVNILFGPNGSGKSTVLLLLARMLHCEQGGVQKVTWHSINELRRSLGEDGFKTGIRPVHDGSPVLYFDPSQAVGLMGSSFDDDFFAEGLRNCTLRASAGQTTLARGNQWVTAVLQQKWPVRDESYCTGRKEYADLRRLLKGTLAADRPTVILDEPSRSLDILSEVSFWINTVFLARRQKTQVIAATHSPFALDLAGVNYIETKSGYLDAVKKALQDRTTHLGGMEEQLLAIPEGCGLPESFRKSIEKSKPKSLKPKK